MKKQNILLSVIGLAIVFAVGFRLFANKKTIDAKAEKAIQDQIIDRVPVKTIQVISKELSNQISESGTFEAIQELKLNAQGQGQITQLFVHKSQFVKKGTMLMTMDNSSLESQIQTAKASLIKAKEDATRLANAYKAGGVSKQQLEDADIRVQSAESQMAALKQQSRNAQIIAPMDGIVNDIFIENGSIVSMGTPLLEIVDITKVNLTVRIDQKSLPNIKLGQKVNVSSDVYPQVVFEGIVKTVNVKADLSQKIEVGIVLSNNREHPLLAGMYGYAKFEDKVEQVKSKSLLIPRVTIIGSIQDAKVYVVLPDSTVVLKSIKTGNIANDLIEVVSGLNENETVVSAGQINLENGTKVVVKNK